MWRSRGPEEANLPDPFIIVINKNQFAKTILFNWEDPL